MRRANFLLLMPAREMDVDKLLSNLLAERGVPARTHSTAPSEAPQTPTHSCSAVSSTPLSPPPPRPSVNATIYFTQQVMESDPTCFFDEILMQWNVTVESAAARPSSVAAAVLRDLSLRETQLLNAKLHEDEFSHPKPGMRSGNGSAVVPASAMQPFHEDRGLYELPNKRGESDGNATDNEDPPLQLSQDAARPHTAKRTDSSATAIVAAGSGFPGAQWAPKVVERSPRLAVANVPQSVRSLREWDYRLFRYYSLAHFAAELDSLELLRFVLEGLPRGVPMLYRPDQLFAERSGSPLPHPVPSRSGGGDAILVTSFPSFDWAARNCADYAGYFLIHRAAMANATQTLAFLVERFGEEEMFGLRRAPSMLSNTPWGADSYQQSRNAVICAIAVGAIKTLSWVLGNCPRQLQLDANDLSTAMISAALEDTVRSFEFFSSNNLFPKMRNNSDATGEATLADAVLLEGLPMTLHACGCYAALYAAAESGSVAVLDWYIRTFGEEVLWLPDKAGATALHHGARGGNTAMLRQLLVDRRTTDCPHLHRHVDDYDGFGRTPAMWCVQGGKKGKHVVDTLKLFESVGSRWRESCNDHGETVAQVAARCHRPFTKVMRFIKTCHQTSSRDQ